MNGIQRCTPFTFANGGNGMRMGNRLRKQSTACQQRSHEKHSKRKEIVLHRIVFTKVKILNEYTKSLIKNKRLMGIRMFFIFS